MNENFDYARYLLSKLLDDSQAITVRADAQWAITVWNEAYGEVKLTSDLPKVEYMVMAAREQESTPEFSEFSPLGEENVQQESKPAADPSACSPCNGTGAVWIVRPGETHKSRETCLLCSGTGKNI